MTDEDTVSLELSKDVALILFDLLQREIDDRNGARLRTAVNHDAELWALNDLNCSLERVLVEPFASNARELVDRAHASMLETCGGRWPD